MVINYNDLSFFRVQTGETVLAFNPGRRPGGKNHRFEANLILTSSHAPEVGDLTQVTMAADGLLIDGPGEYEWRGIFVRGLLSPGPNTIYVVTLDGIRLVHLGALNESKLPDETLEAIGVIDILLLPLGEVKLGLSPRAASDLVARLEPRLVIPADFSPDRKLQRAFLREEGEKNGQCLDKLTIKKKDLEAKENEVIELCPS